MHKKALEDIPTARTQIINFTTTKIKEVIGGVNTPLNQRFDDVALYVE